MEDSRQTPAEIADKCGFSRQKAWRIMNKLEESNRIWGYTTVVDEETAGGKTYFALIKSKEPFSGVIEKLIKRTKGGKAKAEVGVNLMGIHYVNGTYNGIVVFFAKNIMYAKQLCGYIQQHYETHVERIELLEEVFPLIKFGKINPNIEQLKEFAIE